MHHKLHTLMVITEATQHLQVLAQSLPLGAEVEVVLVIMEAVVALVVEVVIAVMVVLVLQVKVLLVLIFILVVKILVVEEVVLVQQLQMQMAVLVFDLLLMDLLHFEEAEAVELAETIVMVDLEVMAEVEPVQIVVGTLVLLEPPTLAVEAVEQVLLTTEHLVPVDQV